MRPKFALSSFAATSPPTSISVGVAVSFYLQVWSGRPLPSPPTGVPGPTEGGPKIVIMVVGMRLLSGENLIDQGVQFLQVAHISTNLAFSLNMVLKSMFVTVPPSPGVYCTSVDALYTPSEWPPWPSSSSSSAVSALSNPPTQATSPPCTQSVHCLSLSTSSITPRSVQNVVP